MFDVTADAYARFMGRFSEPLAVLLAQYADIAPGQRALDVGCGPGALTAVLVDRLGVDAVCAVDPSAPFVAALAERLPGVDVRRAAAEELPFADNMFDRTVAQLVVHFMADPVAGLTEMARVTRPGGVVAASVWDHAGGRGPLSLFWQAVRDVDPAARDESGLAGAREGHLAELCAAAGLGDVAAGSLVVRVSYASFDQWWQPYLSGVGTAGSYLVGLDAAERESVRARCAQLLPAAPFDIEAAAWSVRARV